MSVQILPAAQMAELRRCFLDAGYSERGLREAFETSRPPTRASVPRFLHLTQREEALPVLARVFLAGQSVDPAIARRVWPERLSSLAHAAGLIRVEENAWVPSTVIVPRGEVLFASDALSQIGSPDARDFTLPAGTHAASYLLDLTVRRRVARTLDLGAGCGEQALAAATHSEEVIATDINAHATRYAEFNAGWNGVGNVTCVTGDLFAPVAGQRFDLIVANPPFVPGPGGGFTYRDAGAELDGLCARVVRDAPQYLTVGGMLQMLCEVVELEGQSWQARLQSWLEGLGCDCWVLHSPPQAPPAYARIRLSEVSGALQKGNEYDSWIEYFQAHRVRAIHPAVLLVRRRRGRNWLHVQPLSQEIRGAAGEAIIRNVAACDFLASLNGVDDVLNAKLVPATDLRIEQVHSRASGTWKTEVVRAVLAGALPFDAQLDPGAWLLLRKFDGASSTRACLTELAKELGEDPAEAQRRCLPAVRFFLERGFLLPPAS
jgi:hypothetical protein